MGELPAIAIIVGPSACAKRTRRAHPSRGPASRLTWIEAVDVDSKPRRLVVKLARQGDALSFCLTAMAGQADPDRIRGISVFADLLGDLPMMETGKGSAGGRP